MVRGSDITLSPVCAAICVSVPTRRSSELTAKGLGRFAEKIIETARKHGVPVQEDASLVEVLGKLDVGEAIPPELYQLVAELLSLDRKSTRLNSSQVKITYDVFCLT